VLNKIIFFLLFSITIYSQNFLVVDSLDRKLIDLTFNDEYIEVKSICDSLIKLDNKNPQYYFHYFSADALQLHETINHSPLKDRDSLREILVDKSIEKLENTIQILDELEPTPLNRFYIASLHGYYSRYAGLNRYWWAAYVNGKKANGMFKDIIEEYPKCYDAYLYPGVFGYYAAKLNGFNGFIASILGVSGSRAEGIKYIKLALNKGDIVYPQALLMMLETNTVMEDNPYKAIPFFEKFIKKYPKNKRVVNWYCHTLLNLNKTKKIDELIKNDSLNVVDNFAKSKFFFLTGKIDSAAKYSKSAFQNPNTWKGIIEHTKYFYLYSNWLKGKKEIVKKYSSELNAFYNSLFELDIKNETDSKYIYKLTTLLAKENYDGFKNYLLEKPIFKEIYFESEFNLLNGIFLFRKNKPNKALLFFEKAEKSNDRRKKTIALRYQLDIYLQTPRPIDDAELLMERIEETDFGKLIFRLDDLIKKYNL
jgi:tetratricopeptide (TPR) repeat protein